MNQRIGFMQGRLSPMVGDRIQAFPWSCWAEEFSVAENSNFQLMEWTLDQDRLYENPLLTRDGQAEIRTLCARHGLEISSLTGDCFMQAPFWKASGAERARLQRDFRAIASGCAAVGISIVVIPLVDNGRLNSDEQQGALIDFLTGEAALLSEHRLRVAFECDYESDDLARFISPLDPELFGVNYDIGNSASYGFDPATEIAAYGRRVMNVHIKDRLVNGKTVPLGTGNADFDAVFAALGRLKYTGNYILQTARAADGNHAGVLTHYRDMAATWIRAHGA
jgi:L-ribulose-5-phosphate 3-epimerase